MKKLVSILPILGIFFFPVFSFGDSAIIGAFDNQKILKTDLSEVEKEASCLNLSESNSDTPLLTAVKNFIYSDYIIVMSLLVTASFGVFTFFIALNIFRSDKNLKEAERVLSQLTSEYENLKGSKDSILESLKEELEELFYEYMDKKLKAKIIIQEVDMLLSRPKPDKKEVFSKLSGIIEDIEVKDFHIFIKCEKVFPNDQDIARLTIRALSNIDEKPIPSSEESIVQTSTKSSMLTKLFSKIFNK
jgi:hypothetical protein